MRLAAELVRALVAVGLLTAVWSSHALACAIYVHPDPATARQADAVIVGNVTRFDREGHLVWLITGRSHLDQENYARMTVAVEEVLSGSVAPVVTVYWHQMTNNGPPDRVRGGYVLALKRRPSTVKSREAYDVVQGNCAGALVYPRGSSGANAIRAEFGLEPEPLQAPEKAASDVPWPALAAVGLVGLAGLLIAAQVLWRRRGRKV